MAEQNLNHLIPKRIPKKKLPPPGEVTRIMVNEEVSVIVRYPSAKERNDEFRNVEILELFYKKQIKIKKTVRVHYQYQGDIKVYLFRVYNYNGTGFVLAFNSNVVRWELLYYDF